MKFKFKRLLILSMCLATSMMLFGCGNADSNSTTNDSYIADDGVDGVADKAEFNGADDIADADAVADAVDIAVDDVAMVNDAVIGQSQKIHVEAGVLTAGEWNDNQNWGFFTNLVNANTIEFPSYGLDPRNRVKVAVTDDSQNAVKNATVKLLSSSGETIWTSITDKDGNAYLFYHADEDVPSNVEVSYKDHAETFELSLEEKSTDEQGNTQLVESDELDVTFNETTDNYTNMDVMFIVDTTGSMDDEMLFLQSEFSAIADTIGNENTRYSVNFYRDEGDDYVTKCNDFTSDVSELQKLLNAESANGGGDFPEAVAQVLAETLVNAQWDDDAVKVAFLIFDAPPHSSAENEKIISNAIQVASEKGIRLVPVVSSNSDRDTELFGRALSICTNGTYVFLTDDSGVGESHLEPIVGSYEVEKLYDIIVRIISEYRQQ